MHSEAHRHKFRPRAMQTILGGGAIAGLLDGLDAVIFYRLAFAVPSTRLFQSIASGLLGQESFRGGWLTVVLGIALQFFIAIGAAAFYYAVTLLIPALWRMPWITGPAFGVGLFFFMQQWCYRSPRYTSAPFRCPEWSSSISCSLTLSLSACRSPSWLDGRPAFRSVSIVPWGATRSSFPRSIRSLRFGLGRFGLGRLPVSTLPGGLMESESWK
jgi:hypothetical protein